MKKTDQYLAKIFVIVSFIMALLFSVYGGYILALYMTILGLFFVQEVYLSKNNKKDIKLVNNITTGHILIVCLVIVSVIMAVEIYM